tara:strand:+ start:2088 stop:2792 length:705 start_codon:yes stop_codon:yes gene_type:complete
MNNVIIFKKIKFYNYSFDRIVQRLNKGGYLVAPAASALTNIDNNLDYYESLIKSDIAILDSGFFCILLRVFKNKKVKKLSGYLFLKKFLDLEFEKKTKFFLIDPSKTEAIFNKKYLNKKNIFNINSYTAPMYDSKSFKDVKLLNKLKKIKPKYILVNLGGEIQERLALYLKENLKFKTSIICTGAAIAFLTKRQAPINDFVDKYYLGWIFRIIFSPRKHFIRALKSIFLIKLFI